MASGVLPQKCEPWHFVDGAGRCSEYGPDVWGLVWPLYVGAIAIVYCLIAAVTSVQLLRLRWVGGCSLTCQTGIHLLTLLAAVVRCLTLALQVVQISDDSRSVNDAEIWIVSGFFYPLTLTAFICILTYWYELLQKLVEAEYMLMEAARFAEVKNTPMAKRYQPSPRPQTLLRKPRFAAALTISLLAAVEVAEICALRASAQNAFAAVWVVRNLLVGSVSLAVALVAISTARKLSIALQASGVVDEQSRMVVRLARVVAAITVLSAPGTLLYLEWVRYYAWPALLNDIFNRVLEAIFLVAMLSTVRHVGGTSSTVEKRRRTLSGQVAELGESFPVLPFEPMIQQRSGGSSGSFMGDFFMPFSSNDRDSFIEHDRDLGLPLGPGVDESPLGLRQSFDFHQEDAGTVGAGNSNPLFFEMVALSAHRDGNGEKSVAVEV
mmetsp:Transcript_46283/g.122175  ORF Transcript_46283/g.122175 Transcript_46283/m.122175 type:complete len:436 (+) Transcript_46283:2-1309(+)